MTAAELIVSVLQANLGMALFHIADLSDADLLVRPAPGANHALWQLGHSAASEASVVAKMFPDFNAVDADFAAKFKKDSAKLDDATAFVSREHVVSELQRVRNNTIAAVSRASDADFDKPSPYPDWSPTVGTLLVGLADHLTMHVGQIQVLRRTLGKPVLF